MNLLFRLSKKGGFPSSKEVHEYFSSTLVNENQSYFFDSVQRNDLRPGDIVYYLYKGCLVATAIFEGETEYDSTRDKIFRYGHKLKEIKTFSSSEKINHQIVGSRTCYVTAKIQKEIDRLLKQNAIAGSDDEESYPEGKEEYKKHKKQERSSEASQKAKQDRLYKTGKLECEVCKLDFKSIYGDLGSGFIEAHHTIPVAEMKSDHKTKPSELALVCSNCHRMLHRGKSLLSISVLRKLINENKI